MQIGNKITHAACVVLAGLALSAFKQGASDVRFYKVTKEAPIAAQRAAEEIQAVGGVEWVAPEGWQQDTAPGAMQLVSFSIPETDAKASIVVLGGQGGGTAANVNRWRGQVGLPPAEETEIMKQAETLKGKAGPVQWFEITGTEKSILAALVQDDTQTAFVKLIGAKGGVIENKVRFQALAASVRFSKEPNKG